MTAVLGIIAEYDPFHLGHEYHMREAVRLTGADTVINVISGNFTQRGEAALTDKWSRAEMAIKGGADLVVEMPFSFACNNAGYFAYGGVRLLEALGASHIAFGSETGDLEALTAASERRDALLDRPSVLQRGMKEMMKQGHSYPRALSIMTGENELMGPNDNLAVEYIRNMERAKPTAVLRRGPGHGSEKESEGMASATYIRRALRSGKDISEIKDLVPESTFEILCREMREGGFSDQELFKGLLAYRLAVSGAGYAASCYGAEEGLGNKLSEGFRYASSWEDTVNLLKSKRYTRTRVQRTLIHILMGSTRKGIQTSRLYGRILAMNGRGAEHLRYLRSIGAAEDSGIILTDNVSRALREHPELENELKTDIMASDIYNAALGRDMYSHSEYVKNPLILSGF